MNEQKIPTKIYLSEDDMPKYWYNLQAAMKERHDPMLNQKTLKPMTKMEMGGIFCEDLAEQELELTEEFILIPKGIRDFYKMFRPSPIVRAYWLERKLRTPAHIYYKFEGNNTSGSHKLNTAVAQAYFARRQGLEWLTTETGAGQWGTALSMACAFYGLGLTVYMVKVSSEQKPWRKTLMETYGAEVVASPSDTTLIGKKILAEYPETGGSLGCAISEAMEKSLSRTKCRYVLGSVLDHVLLHQSIIGLECRIALGRYGVLPDIIIGCAGGGSNFGGLIAPYMGDRIRGRNDIRFIAVEPASCPTLTRGRYAYDHGDTGRLTPLIRMYTLGSGFMPSASHAGGLRYHGMSPILSKLYRDGYIEAEAVKQTDVFKTAVMFARCEGILPAPESAHAIKVAVDEAMKCKKTGEKKNILLCLSGTGYFDMSAYSAYLSGGMKDYVPTDADLEKGFATIPDIPQNKY